MRKIMLVLMLLLALSMTACFGGDDGGESVNNGAEGGSADHDTELPPHTHTPSDWITVWTSTCIENGSKHIECTECFEILETELIAATGHNMKNGVCTACGLAYSKGLEFASLGEGNCYVKSMGSCEDVNVVIPPTSPDGENVVKIGYEAFADCKNIISVDIPDSVTEIDGHAFDNCRLLASVNFGKNSRLNKIGTNAFTHCEALGGIIIPDSVTILEKSAFSECAGMVVADIGDGVSTVEDYAFANCTSLENVSFGSCVSEIGYEAFAECVSLKKLDIPDNLVSINNFAFYGCTSITEVNFGKNSKLEAINEYAFAYCDSLGSINIPNSVTTLEKAAFAYCSKLKTVVIGNGISLICDYAFTECTKLESVDFGTGVVQIGYESFSKCEKLRKVEFPESLLRIGIYAFDECSSLTEIDFGENANVRIIYQNAFESCDSLLELTIPDCVETIESSAFANCKSLKSVVVGSGITEINSYTFSNCTGLENVEIKEGVTAIGYEAFSKCTSLMNVSLPSTLTKISDYAFADCSLLYEIVLNDGLRYLGDQVFKDCKTLQVVVLPESLEVAGYYTFSGCDMMKRIYYKGHPVYWERLDFEDNYYHAFVTPYYYCSGKPENSNGNYWYFNEEGKVRIWNLSSQVFASDIYSDDFIDMCSIEESIGRNMLSVIHDDMGHIIGGWEFIHLTANPEYIFDKDEGLIHKKDIYKYVLFDILTGQNAENTLIDTLDNAATSIFNSVGNTILGKATLELTNGEIREVLKETKKEIFKEKIGGVFELSEIDKINALLEFCDNALEAAQSVSMYYALQEVEKGYITVLKVISEDTSNPEDLRNAALELIECYEYAFEKTLGQFQTRVFINATKEDISNFLNEKTWDFIKESDPTLLLKTVSFTGKILDAIMEHIELDEMVHAYYNLFAAVSLENALIKLVEVDSMDYLKYENREKAEIYMSSVQMLKDVILIGTDYSIKFFEAYTSSPEIDPGKDYDVTVYQELLVNLKNNQKNKIAVFDMYDDRVNERYQQYYK